MESKNDSQKIGLLTETRIYVQPRYLHFHGLLICSWCVTGEVMISVDENIQTWIFANEVFVHKRVLVILARFLISPLYRHFKMLVGPARHRDTGGEAFEKTMS